MSNFVFLQAEFREIFEAAAQAEGYVRGDFRSACFYSRRTLELAVSWLYDNDAAFVQGLYLRNESQRTITTLPIAKNRRIMEIIDCKHGLGSHSVIH
jgi:hypothetical protein